MFGQWTIIFFVLCFSGFCRSILVGDNDHELLATLNQDVQLMKSEVTELKQKVSVLEKVLPHPSIAFMASLGKSLDSPAVGHEIVFDVVHLNRGNAYNNVHGLFIAPVNGTYHFSLELSFPATSPNAHRYTKVYLKKGSQMIGYIYSDGRHSDWIKHSATALVDLVAGDDVYAMFSEIGGVLGIAGGAMHSIFSGFLVAKI